VAADPVIPHKKDQYSPHFGREPVTLNSMVFLRLWITHMSQSKTVLYMN
jgi:hypothetical protein